MRELLLGGGTGLVLGIAVQRMGLTRRECLRQTAALRNRQALRVLLMSLGLSALPVSLLMWLAVIDVDELRVVPLHGGTVLGGLLFGAVIGWTGQTPGSAAASLGGDRFFEGACGVAGCLAGAALLPAVRSVFPAIRSLLPESGLTWFRVTLDKPYLFAGGFLGQGCAGLLLLALSLCIRRERPASAPAEKPAEAPAQPEKDEDAGLSTIDEVNRVKLVTAKVIACERVPKSDKLLKETLQVGEETRTVVSGIAQHYTPEEMVGKTVILVKNLTPRKMRGILSEGMLLCACDDEHNHLRLLTVDGDMPSGVEVG